MEEREREVDAYRCLKIKPENRNYCPSVCDPLWQQMPIEYFFCLLRDRSLYFKCMSHYQDEKSDDGQERMPSISFKDLQLDSEERKQFVLNEIDATIPYSYISCWYVNIFLSEAMFRRYGGDVRGVAICTNLYKLKRAMVMAERDTKDLYAFYYGPVQYVAKGNSILNQNAYPEKDGRIDINTRVPYFIKPSSVNEERELRVLCQGRPPDPTCRDSSVKGPKLPIDILNFIDKIALLKRKNDDAFFQMVQTLCNAKGYFISLEEHKEQMDGFDLYTINEIKESR